MTKAEALEEIKKELNSTDSFFLFIKNEVLRDAGLQHLSGKSNYIIVSRSWLFSKESELK